jgi:hypothetical protein
MQPEHWALIHRQLCEGGSSGCHAWLLELLARAACAWPFSRLAINLLHAASSLLEASVAAGAAQPPSQQSGGEAAAALHAVGQGLARVLAGWCLAAGVGPPVVMPRAVRVAAAVATARRTHAETPCLGCSSCLGSLGFFHLVARRLATAAAQAGGPAAGRAQLVRLLPLVSPLVGRALGRQAGGAEGAATSLASWIVQLITVVLQPDGGPLTFDLGTCAASVGLLASSGALDALAAAGGAMRRLVCDEVKGDEGCRDGAEGVGGGGSGPSRPAAPACVLRAQQVAAVEGGPGEDGAELARDKQKASSWLVWADMSVILRTLLASLSQATTATPPKQEGSQAEAGQAAGQAGQTAAGQAGGGPGPRGGGCEPAATAHGLGTALALLAACSGAFDALVGAAYAAPPGDGPKARACALEASKQVGTRGGGGGGSGC